MIRLNKAASVQVDNDVAPILVELLFAGLQALNEGFAFFFDFRDMGAAVSVDCVVF